MKPINPTEDLSGIGNSLLRGDVVKLYYLMILTGTPPAYANKFLFNLRYSDQRANAIQIRNTLINSLKQILMKIVHDPILYQRARNLANRKDFNVFEEIQTELGKTLDEFSIAGIMKKLAVLNNDKDYKKEIANHIINFTEEVQGTAGTQLGQVQGTGTSDGIDSYDLPLGTPYTGKKRKKTMITRRGKMVGNPLFSLTSEGYSNAVNGSLPEEINEALKETGIVVLENAETENMMFLVSEPNDTQETIEEGEELDPVGEEDEDVNNDGEVDDSDKYIKRRRQIVKSAIAARKKSN